MVAVEEHVEVVQETPKDATVLAAAPEEKKTGGLAAPPLPPWLGKPAATPSTSTADAPRKLVIQKSAKKDEKKEEEPQGWQAVMAEMAKKRAQMKNKGSAPAPPPKKEEKKAPMKKIESGKKKKPKDFKDIMDELAYKFASMRGEVEEDSADEAPAPAPAPPSAASEAPAGEGDTNADSSEEKPKPPPGPSPSLTKRKDEPGKKLAVKPDLAAMLAKIKAPPPKPVAEAPALKLPPPPAQKVAPKLALPMGPSGSSSWPAPIGKLAVPKPVRVPGGPPLPAVWPPSPFKAPPGSQAPPTSAPAAVVVLPLASATLAPEPKKQVVLKQAVEQVDLPDGYYIAAGADDNVPAYGILAKGNTTVDLILRLTDQQRRSQEAAPAQQEGASSGTSVTSGQSSDKATLQATRKMTISDLPTPASFAAAIQRMQRSHDLRQAALAAERQLELRNYPAAPSSASRSKSPGGSAGGGSRAPSFFTDKYFEKKSLSFRKAAVSTDESRLPLCSTVGERNARSGIYTYQDAHLGTSQWLQSLRSSDPPPGPAPVSTPGKSPGGRRGASSSSSITTRSSGPPDPRDEYMQTLFSPTECRPPHLLTPELSSRRVADRAGRDQLAVESARQAQEAERRRKERIRRAAVQTAQLSGTFRSPPRLHVHQRMIEKYGGQPGLGMDLAAAAQAAYSGYAAQHLLSPERIERGVALENLDPAGGWSGAGFFGHAQWPPGGDEGASPYSDSFSAYSARPGMLHLDELLNEYDN